MQRQSWRERWKWLFQVVLVAAVYFGAARLGCWTCVPRGHGPALWPAAGIAFAAVLLLGVRVWPGIFLGAMLEHFWPTSGAKAAAEAGSLAVGCGVALGATLQAVWGAGALRLRGDFRPSLDRPCDVLQLTAVALLMGLLGATTRATSVSFAGLGPWADYGSTWGRGYLREVVGILVVTPVLLTWIHGPRPRWEKRRLLETLGWLLFLAAVAALVFGGWFPRRYRRLQLDEFFLLVPLVWGVFRVTVPEMSAGMLALSGIAVWGTAGGVGALAGRSPLESLLMVQGFMVISTSSALLLCAAMRQRRAVEEALRDSEERLRNMFESMRGGIISIGPDGKIRQANPAAAEMLGYRAPATSGAFPSPTSMQNPPRRSKSPTPFAAMGPSEARR